MSNLQTEKSTDPDNVTTETSRYYAELMGRNEPRRREAELLEEQICKRYESGPNPETAKQDLLALAIKEIRERQTNFVSLQESEDRRTEAVITRLTEAIVATGSGDWEPMKELLEGDDYTIGFGNLEITEDQAKRTISNLKASL